MRLRQRPLSITQHFGPRVRWRRRGFEPHRSCDRVTIDNRRPAARLSAERGGASDGHRVSVNRKRGGRGTVRGQPLLSRGDRRFRGADLGPVWSVTQSLRSALWRRRDSNPLRITVILRSLRSRRGTRCGDDRDCSTSELRPRDESIVESAGVEPASRCVQDSAPSRRPPRWNVRGRGRSRTSRRPLIMRLHCRCATRPDRGDGLEPSRGWFRASASSPENPRRNVRGAGFEPALGPFLRRLSLPIGLPTR